MTYSELDTQARTIAATLQALGLQGERASIVISARLGLYRGVFLAVFMRVLLLCLLIRQKINVPCPALQAIIQDSQAAIILSTQAIAHSARALCSGPWKRH